MWNSVAVVKPIGTSLEASMITLSALASEMPLMVIICRFGLLLSVVKRGDSRVSNALDRVVACLNKLLDVARGDAVCLLISLIPIRGDASRRFNGIGPPVASSSSMGSAVAAIVSCCRHANSFVDLLINTRGTKYP